MFHMIVKIGVRVRAPTDRPFDFIRHFSRRLLLLMFLGGGALNAAADRNVCEYC